MLAFFVGLAIGLILASVIVWIYGRRLLALVETVCPRCGEFFSALDHKVKKIGG
jgi:hypothetical protein